MDGRLNSRRFQRLLGSLTQTQHIFVKPQFPKYIQMFLSFTPCFQKLLGGTHPRRPRGSQSEAGEMRIPAPDWAEKIPCIILPNQEPVFAKPFGNGPVRLGTQGFFRPFLKTFVAPFRPPPTDCPWVSEDGRNSFYP